MKKIFSILLLISSVSHAQTQLFEVYNSNKSSKDVRLEAVREGGQVLFKKTETGEILSPETDKEEEVEIEEPKIPPVSEFFLAVSRKNYPGMERQISEGISVDTNLYAGNTALHMASSWNDKKMVNLLLENKASVRISNARGEMPIHLACGYAKPDLIKTLLDQKIIKNPVDELNKKSKNGRTCMHFTALSSTSAEVANYIASFKPDFKLKDEQGQNPGHFAAATRNWNVLTEWLKSKSLDLEDKDKFDMTVEDYILSNADVFLLAKLSPYLTVKSKDKIKERFIKNNLNIQIVE